MINLLETIKSESFIEDAILVADKSCPEANDDGFKSFLNSEEDDVQVVALKRSYSDLSHHS